MIDIKEPETLKQAREVVNDLIRNLKTVAGENEALRRELREKEKSTTRLKRAVILAFFAGFVLGLAVGIVR